MNSQEQRILIINERRRYLKQAKSLVTKYLKENRVARNVPSKTWEKKAIDKNIEQLIKYGSEIENSSTEESLNEYIESRLYILNADRNNESIHRIVYETINTIKDQGYLFEITRYSINYSIHHDLYWIRDGLVDDHSEIARGEKGPEFFESFCEPTIEKLRLETLPYIGKNKDYEEISKILEDICNQFPKQTFLSTNILLHSLIEGMVRTLAKFVYYHQNPGTSIEEAEFYVSKYRSLEYLIGDGNWKADMPIDFADAIIRHRYIQDEDLAKANSFYEDHKELKEKSY